MGHRGEQVWARLTDGQSDTSLFLRKAGNWLDDFLEMRHLCVLQKTLCEEESDFWSCTGYVD